MANKARQLNFGKTELLGPDGQNVATIIITEKQDDNLDSYYTLEVQTNKLSITALTLCFDL